MPPGRRRTVADRCCKYILWNRDAGHCAAAFCHTPEILRNWNVCDLWMAKKGGREKKKTKNRKIDSKSKSREEKKSNTIPRKVRRWGMETHIVGVGSWNLGNCNAARRRKRSEFTLICRELRVIQLMNRLCLRTGAKAREPFRRRKQTV